MRRKGLRGITVFMMILLLALTLLPAGMATAEETFVKTKENTGLGTKAIENPVYMDSWKSPWAGNYVYYGKYPDMDGNSQPVKYRVLTRDTTDFSKADAGGSKAHTMLLDCDSVLLALLFDNDGIPNEGASKANEWQYSDVRTSLNGDSFLNKSGVFTAAEKAAIAASNKEDPVSDDNKFFEVTNYFEYAGLDADRIFLLDAMEATRRDYGYCESTAGDADSSRNKRGVKIGWWLRSPSVRKDGSATCVNDHGHVRFSSVNSSGIGVSPAFNVNLSSVLFSSEISSEPGSYKLTVKDDKLKIAITENEVISRDGDTITVPYTISGDHADDNKTKAVVLITDKEYTDSSAAIKYYGVLGEDGSFKLPSSYQDSWKVYILAENRNGEKETDYASEPETIDILKGIKASAKNVETAYDGKGHGIKVTVTEPESGSTVKYGTEKGSYTLNKSPEITDVKDSSLTVYYKVTAANHWSFIGSATVTITKADQAAPAAPAPEEGQVTSASVTLKEVKGCQYSRDGQNWQDSPVFTGLTKDTEYSFYQRLKGDDNHNPSPASSVKIRTDKSYTVTYTVTGDSPEGAPTAPKDTNEYEEGSPVSVKGALSMTGYTFSGWKTGDAVITDGKFAMPAKDVTLTGSWKADEHTITFDTDGGSRIEAITQAYGTEIKAPADPKKDGFTFSGWDPEIPETMPAKDLTVRARWKAVPEPETQEPETQAPETEPETKETEVPETQQETSEKEDPVIPEKEEAPVRGTLLVKMTAKGKRSLKLRWNKVKGAGGYDIFFSRCSHGSRRRVCKKVKTIKGNKTFSWTKKNLKKNKSYKAYVRAWVKKDGKKTYISTSPLVHAYTSGGSGIYTAPRSVSVKKTKVTLMAGRTYQIKAKVRKLKKNKKLMPSAHTRKLRYMSTNKKVATVSRSGRIRAKAKGSCKIYVYAANGVSKTIRITVR